MIFKLFYIYLYVCVYVHWCTPMYTHVHQCTPMYTNVHPCTPMYTHVHSCTLKYTHVHSCALMYTHVHSCTPMYTHVNPCTPMYTNVHPCTPVYTHVHPCTSRCTPCKGFLHYCHTMYIFTSLDTMYTSVQCHDLETLVLYQAISLFLRRLFIRERRHDAYHL